MRIKTVEIGLSKKQMNTISKINEKCVLEQTYTKSGGTHLYIHTPKYLYHLAYGSGKLAMLDDYR